MQQTLIVTAGILGMSLILSVVVYVFGRLKIEQQKTLQKLIDQGVSGDALFRSAGFASRGSQDLRRGLLLIAIGLAWSVVTFFFGGPAWKIGFVPVAIGAVYLLFRKLDDGSR